MILKRRLGLIELLTKPKFCSHNNCTKRAFWSYIKFEKKDVRVKYECWCHRGGYE